MDAMTQLTQLFAEGRITADAYNKAVAALNGDASNVGTAKEVPDVPRCGRCEGDHKRRHIVDCPEAAANAGAIEAVPADVSTVTYTLKGVKSAGVNTHKFEFVNKETNEYVIVTMPLSRYDHSAPLKVVVG